MSQAHAVFVQSGTPARGVLCPTFGVDPPSVDPLRKHPCRHIQELVSSAILNLAYYQNEPLPSRTRLAQAGLELVIVLLQPLSAGLVWEDFNKCPPGFLLALWGFGSGALDTGSAANPSASWSKGWL